MKIIFLDRDGVINKFPGHGNYVTRVKDFHFLPGSLQAIKEITKSGYSIFVVSNQAGISKGVYSQKKLDQITRYMLKKIKASGGQIKRVLYCVHSSQDNCDCRKPKIGSIKIALQSANKTIRHAKKSFFVGDAEVDVQAGQRAGCRTILVLSGKDKAEDLKRWHHKPDHVVKNLLEATQIITDENSHSARLRRGRAHQGRRSTP